MDTEYSFFDPSKLLALQNIRLGPRVAPSWAEWIPNWLSVDSIRTDMRRDTNPFLGHECNQRDISEIACHGPKTIRPVQIYRFLIGSLHRIFADNPHLYASNDRFTAQVF